jgi:hypothetical protein
MSLNGPDALRALDEALRDIRREEDEIAKRAARGAELLIKLHAQEAELYRLLGTTRLDEAARATQARLIAEIDNAVETAISRYDAAFADAEAAVQHAEADLARGNAERSALQSEAGKRDSELSAHVAVARPKLGLDPGYAAKLAVARELAAMAEASVAKAAEAEADSEQKGRAWRVDPLFMYLSGRHYGTPLYASRGLFAALDARLARFIGYEAAAANYALVKELPVQLRRHAEDLQDRARAAAADVAALESSAIDTAGGRSAREAIEALAARIDALDKEIVALQDRRDAAIEARTVLAHGDTAPYAEANKDLAGLLGQPEIRPLLDAARAAPREDDASIVAQIDDLLQRIKDERAEAREYAEQLEILAVRRRGLEDIQYEIRQRGFDNPHARFTEGRLVQDWLNEFLRGGLSVAAYWDRWRQSQAWGATGYGGPGGGWGRLKPAGGGAKLSRPRPGRDQRRLTSAA